MTALVTTHSLDLYSSLLLLLTFSNNTKSNSTSSSKSLQGIPIYFIMLYISVSTMDPLRFTTPTLVSNL